jgi:hypothetical protein
VNTDTIGGDIAVCPGVHKFSLFRIALRMASYVGGYGRHAGISHTQGVFELLLGSRWSLTKLGVRLQYTAKSTTAKARNLGCATIDDGIRGRWPLLLFLMYDWRTNMIAQAYFDQ